MSSEFDNSFDPDFDSGILDEPEIQDNPLYHFESTFTKYALQLKNLNRKLSNRADTLKEVQESRHTIHVEIPHYSRYVISPPGKNPRFNSEIEAMQKLVRHKISKVMIESIEDDIATATAEKLKLVTSFRGALAAIWATKCTKVVTDTVRDGHFNTAQRTLESKAQQILLNQEKPTQNSRSTEMDVEGGNKRQRSGNFVASPPLARNSNSSSKRSPNSNNPFADRRAFNDAVRVAVRAELAKNGKGGSRKPEQPRGDSDSQHQKKRDSFVPHSNKRK